MMIVIVFGSKECMYTLRYVRYVRYVRKVIGTSSKNNKIVDNKNIN